ncbi:copper amine oxidase N-terminal domain-containing protein [Bacillus tianshenii]|nr:copper amine oxidase N-terminal domain-containing protein [Bacillus tianshenii]
MKKKLTSITLAAGLILSSTPAVVDAHPGRTDSSGGHYCRTNCTEKWGLQYGEYHYHNGGGSSSSSSSSSTYTAPAPKPAPKPKVQTAKVYLNGVYQDYDQPAVVKDGRTLVPLRPVFEALGATVQFDAATETIVATKKNRTVELTVGSTYAEVNNSATYLDAAAQVIDGRTMVPLRFVSEAMGATVKWEDGQVKISY